jgi:hypothetical protein
MLTALDPVRPAAGSKVGLQHMIDEAGLPSSIETALPASWGRTVTGEPMPDVVALLRRNRAGP